MNCGNRNRLLCVVLLVALVIVVCQLMVMIHHAQNLDNPETEHYEFEKQLSIYQHEYVEDKSTKEGGILALRRIKYKMLMYFDNRVLHYDYEEYDLKELADGMDCRFLALNTMLSFPLCIYPPWDDKVISAKTLGGKIHEEYDVRKVLALLGNTDDVGLIDLGAHIGVYSAAAAAMGHSVVAVEPVLGSAKRLVKAASLINSRGHVRVLINAISDKIGTHQMVIDSHDRGHAKLRSTSNCPPSKQNSNLICSEPVTTILMDDLVGAVPFKRAIMKMDLQGHDMKALRNSQKLLQTVNIPTIVMAWDWYTLHYSASENDVLKIGTLTAFMKNLDYYPYDIFDHKLAVADWTEWPANVYWQKQ